MGIYELVESSVGGWNTTKSDGTFGKEDVGDNPGIRDKSISYSEEDIKIWMWGTNIGDIGDTLGLCLVKHWNPQEMKQR